MLTCEEQIAYIKVEARRGKSASEILKALEEVDSGSILRYSTIKRWVREFNNGLIVISNKHLCARTLSATNEENVKNVAKLLKADRRYTCEEIAYDLDISHGSAYCILNERLQMRVIAARWVPHMLSETEKHQCVKIAPSLLQRYEEEGDGMLQRIVAIDETWLRSFEPELKRQSREWHTITSPRPVNAEVRTVPR